MKTRLLIAASFLAFPLLSQANPVPVDAPITKIFVPQGFDDNDNSEVVIHGEFPSSCYKIGSVKADIDEESKEIAVSASALFYPDSVCIQSVTPFIQSVNVGVLKEGTYKAKMKDNAKVTREFSVSRRTTESPDDFLYAPVENAYLEVDYATGKQSIKLQGTFPYLFIGCMVIKEVRSYQAPSDVLVVLPIAEIVDGPQCEAQGEDPSFQYTQGLSQPFSGEGLMHVRTLHGNSLNRFLQVLQ
ncbi:MAG: hypothetical protein HRU19_06615 [Pseudobacteriovorax sp.]|nr:hypothetical protein [Pseudobacteriovorax sp.]